MKVYVGFRIYTDASILKESPPPPSFSCVAEFCICLGDAQSCFCVCILSSSGRGRSWLEEPGNLGICKVSTITKAINLDTIRQSGNRNTEK